MNAANDTDVAIAMREMAQRARSAARVLAASATGQRNAALRAAAEALGDCRSELLQANADDLHSARERNLDAPLIDRLELTDARVDAMQAGLEAVAMLPDPVGAIRDLQARPSGIRVGRMRVPLGVIGIIYESRPNVTAEAASLCLKSANSTILRGGSEALRSNAVIARAMREGLLSAGLPESCIELVATRDRAAVGALLGLEGLVDVVVPRGGKGLIERIARDAKVPVIKHLDGICHVYIDSGADPDMALAIAVNAKTQRYGTCNTMETLLIHVDEAPALLPRLMGAYAEHGVEVRG